MTTRASLVTVFAVAMGLAVSSASVRARSNADRLTFLTFSGPVALPGVTLAPGTYALDILSTASSTNVVRVRNEAHSQMYFVGMTQRIDRPAGMPRNGRVSFGEARNGEAPPIVAWYPSDSVYGLRFLYPRAR